MIVPECNICLQTIYPPQIVKITPCYHYYHSECFNRWANTIPPNTKSITFCPTCRYEVPTDIVINDTKIDIKYEPTGAVFVNNRNELLTRIRLAILVILILGTVGTVLYLIVHKTILNN